MPKRRRVNDGEDGIEEMGGSMPKRRTRGPAVYDLDESDDAVKTDEPTETPTKPRRGRPPGSVNKLRPTHNAILSNGATPTKTKGKVLFSTTAGKTLDEGLSAGSPSKAAHRHKYSSREQSTGNDLSANGFLSDEDEEDDLLTRKIRGEDATNSESSDEAEPLGHAADSALNTPAKQGQRKRRKKKSPTPPQDLPPHERYSWQNRPGRVKTSNNTLFSVPLLTHEEYHEQISAYQDPNAEAYETLYQIHTHSFPQWRFELSQDFNICLYGYGSKRRLVTDFAKYLHEHLSSPPQILIVNGYTPTTTLRTVFTTLATLVYNCKSNELPSSLGSQPRDILASLLTHLTGHPPTQPIYIFINSLDAAPLRRSPTPSLLAQLAAHPSIHMLATCDTPNFPLLWDTGLREQYNWLFHDTTTFQSYGGVEIGSVVDEVNELLGRSGRSVKGKGGAGFVLKSLPENARSLYRVLIAEILTNADDGGEAEGGEGGERRQGGELGGVERKALYQKVVEEFICSNEMGFGQLLNEFFDHDMLVDKRDADGTKVLGVPWRREECEEILEELMG